MLTERRRSALPIEFVARVGLVWILVSAMLIGINWGSINAWRFPDPDDTMRLIQVRDLLAGQSWFDVTQYRVDAQNGGVAMHWSRIVDIPLVAVIAVLMPILGTANAELAALVMVPLLTLFLALMLATRITWRLCGDEEATLTALIMAASVPVLFQLGPMRIDHHGWQIVCALVAVNGLMARSPRAGGWMIGASLATWLSISIEGLPLSAAIFAVLALRWLRDRTQRGWLVHGIQALAATSIAWFGLTRGIGDFATYCDALSPLHVGMFVFGAAGLTLLNRLEPVPLAILLVGFAVIGGGAAAMLLYTAPQCVTGGGFADLDPVVAEMWHSQVGEGMPFWRQDLTTIAQYMVMPLIAVFAAINLVSTSRDWLRNFWTDYTLILIAAWLVSLFVARAGAVACILAAPPLAWQVRRWLRAIRHMDSPLPRAGAMVAAACAILPTLPLQVLTAAMPAHAQEPEAAAAGEQLKSSNCRIEDSAGILRALPQGEIYALLDIAPKILLVSDHSVPATAHHRGNTGMAMAITTALGSSADARMAFIERGTAYVALCPNLLEARNYAAFAPDGFAADLVAGREPDWLQPIATASRTSFRLYRIKPE